MKLHGNISSPTTTIHPSRSSPSGQLLELTGHPLIFGKISNICTSSKVDFHKVWPSSQQVSPWAQTPLKEDPFQVNSREMFIILSADWLPDRSSCCFPERCSKQQVVFMVYFFGGLRLKLPTISQPSLSTFLGYIYLEPK